MKATSIFLVHKQPKAEKIQQLVTLLEALNSNVIQLTPDDDDLVEKTAVVKPVAVIGFHDRDKHDTSEYVLENSDNPCFPKTIIILDSDTTQKIQANLYLAGADTVVENSHEIIRAIISSLLKKSSLRNLKIKDLEIDLVNHKVTKAGEPITLTFIQFKLLYLLVSNPDTVFSRKEISKQIWGLPYSIQRNIDVHIKRLRENLGEYNYPSQYIETVHGVGYQIIK